MSTGEFRSLLAKPTKRITSVMVRLVQYLGIGSTIGATPAALLHALIDI